MLRVGAGALNRAPGACHVAALASVQAQRLKKLELGGVRWKRGGEQANKPTLVGRRRRRQAAFAKKRVADPFSLHENVSKEVWASLPRTPIASLQQRSRALLDNTALEPQFSWQNVAEPATAPASQTAATSGFKPEDQRKADLEAFEKAVEAAAAFKPDLFDATPSQLREQLAANPNVVAQVGKPSS